MPENEAEVVTTEPAPESAAQTTEVEDPREGASRGIQKRLDRLEKNVRQTIEETQLRPLQEQLDRVLKLMEEKGIDPSEAGIVTEGQEQEADVEAPVETASQTNVEYLRLKAAYEAGLPQEVLPLITASDEAGISAQVSAIRVLNPRGIRLRSPVPPSTDGKSLPVFKQSQLSDGKFYSENKEAIVAAMADGRIDMDR